MRIFRLAILRYRKVTSLYLGNYIETFSNLRNLTQKIVNGFRSTCKSFFFFENLIQQT